MSALVFLDIETTGLELDADIWEFAGIRRSSDGRETELHLFIEHDEEKCKALPLSFRDDHYRRFPGHHQEIKAQGAAWQIGALLRPDGGEFGEKVHVVGAVPSFDTQRLARLLGESPWHHHLIDVEAMALGWLAARKKALPELPWSSDDLSRSCGVEPPAESERHTALGDARWAMRWYDAMVGAS